MYIATVIAAQNRPLTSNLLASLKVCFNDVYKIDILDNKLSADIYFSQERSNIKELLSGFEVDVIIQPEAHRFKKLLLCDMESTIIQNEFLDDIAEILNIKQKVAEITERAMNGEIGFESALMERLDLIKSLPEIEIKKLLQTRLKYNPGARELIAACRRAGIYTMLVSGGFTLFTDHVAKELGFDEAHANQLVFDNGYLSHVKQPILGKEAKLKFLQDKAEQLNIPLWQTATIGDGANDLPMLHGAGLGLAYKAKPKVKDEIHNQINHTDLMAAAYSFGIEI